ncbi:hypothetical protein [Methanolapillus millepedarum]|uniref:DUF4065 domain-containing protein n=1 Tax=Methanolapillus millepedarum TaxID=3028296 RepID=A0AA96ZV58_9EURY|nr:hypothetical protein MsAc7_00090 [Methanosarcinaceae archaeon Ac7]
MELDDKEKLIIYSIGSNNQPIKTKIEYQKLLFLVSTIFPQFKEDLDFEPYNYGPYSEVADVLIEEFMVMGYVLTDTNQKAPYYSLASDGLDEYTKIQSEDNFSEIRDIVDKTKRFVDELSDKELLVYVYVNYPEYIENSIIWDRLEKELPRIFDSLVAKNVITSEDKEKLMQKYG